MPRAAVTSDVFNAIAESARRELLSLIAAAGEEGRAVGALVASARLPQPTVSKHLAVLLAVGLVGVQRRGRQRLYRLNAAQLKAVHDWTSTFERYWDRQIDRIKSRAERKLARPASTAFINAHSTRGST